MIAHRAGCDPARARSYGPLAGSPQAIENEVDTSIANARQRLSLAESSKSAKKDDVIDAELEESPLPSVS
jgi:hypothetical protein